MEPASKVYITRRSRLSLKTIGKHCWSELHQSSQEQTSKLLYYLERRSPDLLFCKFCGKLHKPCVNCASLRQLQANFTGMEPGWLKFPGTPVSPIHFDYAYMIMRTHEKGIHPNPYLDALNTLSSPSSIVGDHRLSISARIVDGDLMIATESEVHTKLLDLAGLAILLPQHPTIRGESAKEIYTLCPHVQLFGGGWDGHRRVFEDVLGCEGEHGFDGGCERGCGVLCKCEYCCTEYTVSSMSVPPPSPGELQRLLLATTTTKSLKHRIHSKLLRHRSQQPLDVDRVMEPRPGYTDRVLRVSTWRDLGRCGDRREWKWGCQEQGGWRVRVVYEGGVRGKWEEGEGDG